MYHRLLTDGTESDSDVSVDYATTIVNVSIVFGFS
jgi:hypothetical protein